MTTTAAATEPTVREMMRDQWERRRAETDHRTYAVPFRDSVAVPMAPAEYERALALAADGDQDFRAYETGGFRTYTARSMFDVLVLA